MALVETPLRLAKHTLHLEPDYDCDFELISIISGIRDYRLCWHLNQHLGFDFARQPEIQLHYPKKQKYGYFNLYEYEDELNWLQYYFIVNKSLGENLIPELKQVDYLLLIKGGSVGMDTESLLHNLKQIKYVEAAFQTDPTTLRSRQNLILE